MTRQQPPILSPPTRTRLQARRVAQRLWHWFIEPSPKITESDQRRQATLLTGFLLGLMVVAILLEVVTTLLLYGTDYTGYRQTIIVVVILGLVYFVSRTQYAELAAILSVVVTSLAVFLIGWGEPRSVLGGMFDFLILPLWLGSLFIDLKKLPYLIAGELAGLLIFPLLVPQITLNDILIGPFSFVAATSIMLIIITHHRNNLERDRRAELLTKEQRAEALLRVAGRLNSQLDLEALLNAISEEVSRALGITVAIVALYNREQKHLYAAAGVGLSADSIKKLPPLSKSVYDETVKVSGADFSVPDLRLAPDLAYLNPFREANLRSMAFATMHYDQELIGSLNVFTLGDQRDFTKDELLLLRGLADQAALALVNTRLYKDARRRLERLQALRTIDVAITTNRDLRKNLEVLLDNIKEQLKVDAAVFLLLDENKQHLEFASSLGFHTSTLQFTRLRLGEGMAGRAALQRKIVHVQDLRIDPQTLANAPALAQEGFVSYFAAPLIAQGQVKGVLEIFHRSLLNPDEEWLSFLEALAGQAAIAIESTTLFDDLQSANDELSQAYDSTIEGWSHALDLRDKETEGHTQRVTQMTLTLARSMGINASELVHIRRGALLHDIGKMGVPDHILLKPGALTEEEWAIMRKHPVYAHELLTPIAYLRPALDIPYCHHEKWDGTGYPRGLTGTQIPFTARLFALVDVWDALTSDRPYRKGWSKEKALEHIQSLAGTHFDPKVVELFLHTLNEAPEEHSGAG
jgi:HD-GYP domain-containing protein (c-di-GMP phosphodiesterase class II)